MENFIFFFIGLVGLWFGSELITRGALTLAQRLGLSQSFIGMTVLALGTDFPEIMVAITGAREQLAGRSTAGIIIGNIIGSNMGQISLVLGLAGLVSVMKVKKKEIWTHGLMLVFVTVLFLLLSVDGVISRVDGLIFLSFYLLHFLFIKKTTKRAKFKSKLEKKKKSHRPWLAIAKLGLGLFFIAEASHMVVTYGVEMAVQLGVSQLVIGVLLIGIGTSLPELVVSLNAVLKGANELSISNLIGSNIVDICVALGSSALIVDWPVDRRVVSFDLVFLLLTSVAVVLFLLTKQTLERKESVLVLGLYGVYVALKVSGF